MMKANMILLAGAFIPVDDSTINDETISVYEQFTEDFIDQQSHPKIRGDIFYKEERDSSEKLLALLDPVKTSDATLFKKATFLIRNIFEKSSPQPLVFGEDLTALELSYAELLLSYVEEYFSKQSICHTALCGPFADAYSAHMPNNQIKERDKAIFGMDCCRFVSNIAEWWMFHRSVLLGYDWEERTFIGLVAPFFPRILFSQNHIPSYLGTLYYPLNEIKTTVLYHLILINDHFHSLFSDPSLRSRGAKLVAEALEQQQGNKSVKFGASGEDDRTITELNIDFESDGHVKTVYCDLHTKIWHYWEKNSDSGSVHSGDRIYFCEPQPDFAKDKILVGRIGKHRK